MDINICPCKLKTPMIEKIFKSDFIPKGIGILRKYCLLWITTIYGPSRATCLQVWVVTKIIFDTLMHMVNQCIINQNQGYGLLSDVFIVAIFGVT